ncbi:unnamed protein product [Moneuplotes crassus]|uniref:Uncharacterized protein n=1 Tax=Euplotes crassus TaxID=5936 RepID=A0AAD1Y372_EUPCR|nr:unnamed protein product [Moneuplotes crassus]
MSITGKNIKKLFGQDNSTPDKTYLQNKQDILDAYRKTFLPINNQFRVKVMKCQLLKFETNLDYLDAQKEARKCFKPYAVSKRHTDAIIDNIEFDFVRCMTHIPEKNIKSGKVAGHKKQCVELVKEQIQEKYKLIEKITLGYMKNLD